MPRAASRWLSHCEFVSRFWPLVISLPIAMISACMGASYKAVSPRPESSRGALPSKTPVAANQSNSQLKACPDAVVARLQIKRSAQELRPTAGESQPQADAAGGHIGGSAPAKGLEDAALL